MKTPNDGGSAFPQHEVFQDCGINGNSGPILTQTISHGMTLRDHFAGAVAPSENIVLAIMIASGKTPVPDDWNQEVAIGSYRMADAMLSARERKEDA